MEVLSSRVLLRAVDVRASHSFYRDVLGLAVYREFGGPSHPGVVFFLGGGLLEVTPGGQAGTVSGIRLWIQVRDVAAERTRLDAAAVPIVREPVVEPWGLKEMWISDPDDVQIVLVEIPSDHPLRRDQRDRS